MSPPSALPSAVGDYLNGHVVRTRRTLVIRAIAWSALLFTTWGLFCCAADRLIHLPAVARAILLAAGVLLSGAGLLHAFWRSRRPIDWTAAAVETEREHPEFRQRLVTVTSRLLGSSQYRGSDEMLAQLLREVEALTGALRLPSPVAGAARPWLIFVLTVIAIAGLGRVPWLGLPHLAVRFLVPLTTLPPVTTTRLAVSPGNRDVVQSESLTIDVNAEKIAGGVVWLYLSQDGASWSRSTMGPAGDDRFTTTLTGVDRDLRYYVAGGDAVSPVYMVRVLRRPAVASFTIRYIYPAYTHRVPLTVSNTDGLIEAPIGSTAMVFVTATEPLESALLTLGAEKKLMLPTSDERVRQVEVPVVHDGRYDIDLISTRQMVGGGPAGSDNAMAIRAIPDRPPLVRLDQAGQTLRLNPRDILRLSYQVLDDYGVVSLVVRAQVNASAASDFPVHVTGDPRRQEDVANFDLAALTLGIGDVVTVTLTATDGAGQPATSEPVRVLVSPRSIDVETHEEIAELAGAADLAATLVSELDSAGGAVEEADGVKDQQSPQYLAVEARGNRYLSGASEVATLLRQSLLHATVHSRSPEVSVALAGWVDAAQMRADAASDLFSRSGAPSGMGNIPRDLMRHEQDLAREMQSQILAMARGLRASAVLADRENLRAGQRKPAPADAKAAERLRQTLERTQQDIAAEAAAVGVDPAAPNLDDLLRQKEDAAHELARLSHVVDFSAAAREWARSMQDDAHHRSAMDARLFAAAQAEAVRPDADLIRARDLELAGRAALSLDASFAEKKTPAERAGRTLGTFATALADLQHEHELDRQPADVRPADERKRLADAAEDARRQMQRWAGDGEPTPDLIASSIPRGRLTPASAAPAVPLLAAEQRQVEEMALHAAADTARHDYTGAAALDKVIAGRLENEAPPPAAHAGAVTLPNDDAVQIRFQRVQSSMASARKIDDIGQTQEEVTVETRGARPEQSPALVNRELGVADAIENVGQPSGATAYAGVASQLQDGSSRDRASETMLRSQEQLAAMPQKLADVRERLSAARAASERAEAGRREAQAAAPERQQSVARTAAQAARDAVAAGDALRQALTPVSEESARALSQSLAPFVPEASGACEVIDGSLAPALASLRSACEAQDPGAAERAAADARRAMDAVQKELARAQDAFMERDPLVAAKWFARAAASSLSVQPPDFKQALSHQARVTVALSRAWDQSIHEAASRRLGGLPSMRSLFAAMEAGPHLAAKGNAAGSPNFAAAREWSRLRPQESPALGAPLREADPPGFEESIRLYFEAMGKAQHPQ